MKDFLKLGLKDKALVRYTHPKKIRKFDGEQYKLAGYQYTKSLIDDKAGKLRGKGMKARIVSAGKPLGGYLLYAKKRSK